MRHAGAPPRQGCIMLKRVDPPANPVLEELARESPTQRLDRLLHTSAAPLTGGLSPVALALAWADWAWHLAVSPGRQMDLAATATQLATDTCHTAVGLGESAAPAGDADDDPRFRHPAWAAWPFNALRSGFRNSEAFWRDAAYMPGMTAHHNEMTRFFAKQWLGLWAPANWPLTNPVVLQDAVEAGGAHQVRGAMNWLRDVTGQPDPDVLAEGFVVGAASAQHLRRDPLLPAELLPSDWPGDDLRVAYASYVDAFGRAVSAWSTTPLP